MIRCTVDTNVPIVANGLEAGDGSGRSPSIVCRISTVNFLKELLDEGVILLDLAGEIEAEYRRHLNPRGQPGVGDRFYHEVLRSAPRLVERVELRKGDDGEYLDLPQALVDAGFDPSDRKFAALAAKEQVPVVNAVDSDWLEHREVLRQSGIVVNFLCTCDTARWFTAITP